MTLWQFMPDIETEFDFLPVRIPFRQVEIETLSHRSFLCAVL